MSAQACHLWMKLLPSKSTHSGISHGYVRARPICSWTSAVFAMDTHARARPFDSWTSTTFSMDTRARSIGLWTSTTFARAAIWFVNFNGICHGNAPVRGPFICELQRHLPWNAPVRGPRVCELQRLCARGPLVCEIQRYLSWIRTRAPGRSTRELQRYLSWIRTRAQPFDSWTSAVFIMDTHARAAIRLVNFSGICHGYARARAAVWLANFNGICHGHARARSHSTRELQRCLSWIRTHARPFDSWTSAVFAMDTHARARPFDSRISTVFVMDTHARVWLVAAACKWHHQRYATSCRNNNIAQEQSWSSHLQLDPLVQVLVRSLQQLSASQHAVPYHVLCSASGGKHGPVKHSLERTQQECSCYVRALPRAHRCKQHERGPLISRSGLNGGAPCKNGWTTKQHGQRDCDSAIRSFCTKTLSHWVRASWSAFVRSSGQWRPREQNKMNKMKGYFSLPQRGCVSS